MGTPSAAGANSRFSPRALGLALGLALAATTATADDTAPGKGTFESDRPASRVVLAGATRDTLEYDHRDTFPLAITELESDHWTIQRADTARGRIVTHWKPMKHVLAQLFLGQVMGRCVVDLEPLPDGRTVLTIQGGLASNEDLTQSPLLGAAQAAYRRASTKWINNVRHDLDDAARQGLVSAVTGRRDRPASPAHESN